VRSAIPKPHKGIPRLASELSAQTCAGAYRFGFNGQEKDDEVHGSAGTSLDFGARMYGSREGRFLSLDPLASKFAGQSPYLFAGDNPIYYIDKNGEYKLPPGLQQQYPMLTNLVKNLETIMRSDERLWTQFKENLGLTEEQATEMVKWDSGPTLGVAPLANERKGIEYGRTLAPDGMTILLNEAMIKTMEGQHISEDGVTDQQAAALTFVTLGHEGQHRGEIIRKGRFFAKWKGEIGYRFEKKALGKKYHVDNAGDFKGDHPMLFQRVTDSTTDGVERMEVRPTTIQRDEPAEKKPIGR
jgi:RHS repeat-associated protein